MLARVDELIIISQKRETRPPKRPPAIKETFKNVRLKPFIIIHYLVIKCKKGFKMTKDKKQNIYEQFDNYNYFADEYNTIPTYIWRDPEIFSDEEKAKLQSLPAYERADFVIEAINKFYLDNPEYSIFAHETIYKDPLKLLEFFQNIKKSHLKKAGVDSNIYADLQKELEKVEKHIANNPIDYNNIKFSHICPILRLREPFTESQLAKLYYIQNPKEENFITDILSDDHDFYLPFGPWLPLTSSAIGHAAARRNFKYEVTKTGKKRNDRSKELIVNPTAGGFELIQRSKSSYSSITIINKDLIQSATALKLFVFLLAKAAQQSFKPIISFSLQELVNIGMYTNTANARAGFKKQILAVQSLQIAGEIKKGKREIKQKGGVLFYQYDIDNNIVKVWVNENFYIEFLASYYTYLPRWAFELNNNAFRILLDIYEKARIEKKTTFNISLATIRDKLTLPTKEEYADKGKKWKPAQYVKQPITEAIEAIEAAIEANKDNTISISKHYIINDQNLDEWLNGYITVNLTGDYSEKLKLIKEKQQQIVDRNVKKKEAAEAAKEQQKNEKTQ